LDRTLLNPKSTFQLSRLQVKSSLGSCPKKIAKIGNTRLLRLPSLAPDIITAIINGKNPPQLTAKKLMRLALQIPIDWAEQRKLLGFQ
jgi:hypothetical protein